MQKKLLALGICILVFLIVLSSVYINNEKKSKSLKINGDENYNGRPDRTNLSKYLSIDEIEFFKSKISEDLLKNGIPNYAYLNDTLICFLVTYTRPLENEEIIYIFNEYGKMGPWGRDGYFSQPSNYYYSIINLNINKFSDFLNEELVQKIENIDRPHLLDEEIVTLKEKNDNPINQGVKGLVTLATGDYLTNPYNITIENISAIIYFINNETKDSYVAVSKDDGNYKIELPTGNYTVVYIYYNNTKEIRMFRSGGYTYYASPYYYMDNIDTEHYMAYYRELCLKYSRYHIDEIKLSYIEGYLNVQNNEILRHDIYINRVTW